MTHPTLPNGDWVLTIETWWLSFTEISVLCPSPRVPNGAGKSRRMKTNNEIINTHYVTHATPCQPRFSFSPILPIPRIDLFFSLTLLRDFSTAQSLLLLDSTQECKRTMTFGWHLQEWLHYKEELVTALPTCRFLVWFFFLSRRVWNSCDVSTEISH